MPLRVPGAREAVQAPVPERRVNVALFRNLPGSTAPVVSAATDKTLGSMDVLANLLSKLEGRAPLLDKLVHGFRGVTRLAGPGLWGVSSILQWRMIGQTWQDPTLARGSKIALTAGTVANTVGALAAAVSALPARFVGLLRINPISANKVAGLAGGVGGTIFNTINFIETMRNPASKPGERLFAQLGFGLAVAGFVCAAVALATSLPALAPVLAKAPAVLPIATKAANWLGMAGLGAWLGQLLLGKNDWFNARLQGGAAA